MRESVKEKKVQKRYEEEFKRQAVELKSSESTMRTKDATAARGLLSNFGRRVWCVGRIGWHD